MRSAARPDGAVAASYIRRFAPRSPGGLSNSDSGPSQPDSPWHCAEEATVPTSRGSFSKGVTNWRRDSGGAGVGGGSSGGGGDCGGDCGGVGGGGVGGGGGSGGGGSGGGGSGEGLTLLQCAAGQAAFVGVRLCDGPAGGAGAPSRAPRRPYGGWLGRCMPSPRGKV